MYILGFDTTQAACSAAVYDTTTKQVCARVWQKMPRGHAEALPEIIQQTLLQANLSFKDIGKLATSIGPGTFTGVRVGLSAARGFALALNLPLVGITSLETIAANVDNYQNKLVLAVFDARRDEIYVQLFNNGQPCGPAQLLDVEQASKLAGNKPAEVVGTASELLACVNKNLLNSDAPALPDAAIVATLADYRDSKGQVQPLYLRRADAKAQKPLLNIEPGKLVLKPATIAHSEILAEIHAQGFSNPWDADSIRQSLSSPGVSAMLATDGNDEPLGFIIARDAAKEREILTLAVRLDARRRKVGQCLIEAISQPTADKIFLEVSENNFAAQNLYEKMSFVVCGRRKKYYTENDGQKYDAILMEHTL